jgi:hypothetical protein
MSWSVIFNVFFQTFTANQMTSDLGEPDCCMRSVSEFSSCKPQSVQDHAGVVCCPIFLLALEVDIYWSRSLPSCSPLFSWDVWQRGVFTELTAAQKWPLEIE